MIVIVLRGGSVKKLLALQELPKYSKLQEITLYKYVRAGKKIQGAKTARRWRFDKEQIDDFLEVKKD